MPLLWATFPFMCICFGKLFPFHFPSVHKKYLVFAATFINLGLCNHFSLLPIFCSSSSPSRLCTGLALHWIFSPSCCFNQYRKLVNTLRATKLTVMSASRIQKCLERQVSVHTQFWGSKNEKQLLHKELMQSLPWQHFDLASHFQCTDHCHFFLNISL